MKETIALIDDDRNILTSLSIALEKEGFKVQTYLDGESALIGLTRTPPDLAVIDIKMPKMDGEELLKKIRKKTSLPVIFLTSKDEEIDELLGLKLGADDFIKKSGGFSIKVLIERIRVQLRKKNTNNLEDTKNIIAHGKLKLDPSQLECEWDGKQLPDKLTTTEFLIVQELARRPGMFPRNAPSITSLAIRSSTTSRRGISPREPTWHRDPISKKAWIPLPPVDLILPSRRMFPTRTTWRSGHASTAKPGIYPTPTPVI